MTPVPQPKTNEIADQLWPIFLEGEPINVFQGRHFRQEIQKLKFVDPEDFIMLSGLLAAANDNIDEVLEFSKTALQLHKDENFLDNWSNILVNLGLVRESYAFIKRVWEVNPGDVAILKRVITFASALEDAPILEKALEAWHDLNPGKTHPLVVNHMLNEWVNSHDTEVSDEEIIEKLETLDDDIVNVSETRDKRMKKLLNALMAKVDI